jgi:hypothetical protein
MRDRMMKHPSRRKWTAGALLALAALLVMLPGAHAQRRGPKHDADRQHDMETFHFLLQHRDGIARKVTKLPNGIETLTESNDAAVTAKLHEHVEAMDSRLKERRPIHMRDPLFREIFRNAEKVQMTVERTDKGLKVTETSQDPYVVRLIQAHADVLNQFLAKGHEEVRQNHPVPKRDGS